MAPVAAANAMTKITLSFLLSLLGDKNFQGPEAPVNSKYHWAYKGPEGPDSWHVHYKYCAGERQSPIGIKTSSCEYDPRLEPIVLENFDATSGSAGPCILNVTNNGHAASVRVLNQDMRVRGGGLGQDYKTVEFHFHWGSTDDVGSEHAVNGKKYPLEMHVVNYAEKYGNVKAAMTQPDGLAVLGVFFEITEKDNPYFAAVDESLRHIHKAGDHATINQLRLMSLLPDDLSKFWRYNGSLTTPFCFESVIWTVFTEPQKISKSQLEILRTLLHEEGHDISDRGEHHSFTPSRLVDNWRPLQPLNGRVVKQSFRGDFIHNKPPLDTKITSFEASAPTLAIANRPDSLGGTVMYNINPTFQPIAPQEMTKDKAMPQASSKIQARITEINNLKSQESFGRGPVEEKLLIYNQSPSVEMGVNSSPITLSSEKSQQVEVNRGIGLADSPATTLFGQIQQSNQALTANSGPESSVHHPGEASAQMSSSSALKADLKKDVGRLEQNNPITSPVVNIVSRPRHVSSSGANGVLRNVQSQQSSNSGKVTMVINTSTSTPSSRVHVSLRPNRLQSSGMQPSVQVLPIAQQQKAQSSEAAGRSQPLPPKQQTQTQPNTNRQQQQSASAVSQSNLRSGQIDSRIAALANNIRSHRHLAITQIQPNTQPANNNPQMPPVIRHNKQIPPIMQNQQRDLISQRQQQYLLQQPPQQIQRMSRPPTPQQLRAIFEKLAAFRRANARSRIMTSGAATIPRLKLQQVNSVSGTRFLSSPASRHYTGASHGNQHFNIPRDNSQFLSPDPSTSLQSSWTNPNTNLDYNGQAGSSYQPPQTYWLQPSQQQTYSQRTGYQQSMPLQQNTQQQQVYPQQQQVYHQQQQAYPQQQQQAYPQQQQQAYSQQQQAYPQLQQAYPQQQQAYTQQQPTPTLHYTPAAPTAMYSSPMARSDNTNLYYTAGPGVSGASSNAMPLPQVSAMDANTHQVYLNNQKQPVRILRPVYEQVNSRQQAQYQNQQYPFFVY